MLLSLTGIVLAVLVVALLSSTRQRRDLRALANRLSAQNRLLREEDDQNQKKVKELGTQGEWRRFLFNSVSDMVFVYGVTKDGLPGEFTMVNDSACSALKYRQEALLSMTPLDIEVVDAPFAMPGYSRPDLAVLPDEYIQKRERNIATRDARHLVEQVFSEGRVRYERVYRDSQGKKFPVEIDARRVDFEDRQMVMCVARNIMERREAEQTLSESRQRFRNLVMHSSIGIAMYDRDKTLVDVNQACLKMFGIPDREEFARFDVFDNPFVPADVRNKLNRGENVRYEAIVDFQEALNKSIFVTNRTGTAHLDILLSNMGLDEKFSPRGYFIQVHDLTTQRRAEEDLQQTEQQLRQAEKMEAIGSIAGGIAHDFNNILTPILGCAKMLTDGCSDADEAYKLAARITKAAHRAKDLVREILTFSRKTEEQDAKSHRPIRVTPVLKEVLALQRASLPADIEITAAIKTDQDAVLADSTKIHQVLMNLCRNAAYAMRDAGGTLELRLSSFAVTRRTKGQFSQLEPGRYLRISVKDTGTGMDEATAERVFEPFFTTKARGEGVGMGLAVVHGIVKSFKGAIVIETGFGKGSVFHVDLPLLEEDVREEGTKKDGALPSGNERVLVVDDDPDVVATVVDMLGSLGYESVAADNGESALRLFKMDPSYFDMVLTDQVMPGTTGIELSKKIRAVRPDIPVVLCTGFGEIITSQRLEAAAITELIKKPVEMQDLAVRTRRALDEKPERTRTARSDSPSNVQRRHK